MLVLAAISFITFKWVLIPIRTEGSSMLPTYGPAELNLVNRLAYRSARAGARRRRRDPDGGSHVLYVKRVIGLPGERVAVSEGQVQINGAPLPSRTSATGVPGTSTK